MEEDVSAAKKKRKQSKNVDLNEPAKKNRKKKKALKTSKPFPLCPETSQSSIHDFVMYSHIGGFIYNRGGRNYRRTRRFCSLSGG